MSQYAGMACAWKLHASITMPPVTGPWCAGSPPQRRSVAQSRGAPALRRRVPEEAEIERLGPRRCGGCGGEARRTVGRQAVRRWRDLGLRDRPLVLVYRPHRVRCARCGVRVERVPWAARWARAVALLARKLSWAEVAAHCALDWKTVAAIVREAVAVGLKLRRWRPLHVLGRRRGRSVRVVCCDKWDPYVEACQTHLPPRSASSLAFTSSLTSTVPWIRCAGRPGGSSPAPSGPASSAPAGCG
jgi:transposase